MAFTVGTQGFSTYQEAAEFAQKQGYGSDAIHGEEARVDVYDRESKAFIVRDIPEHEARDLQIGNPSYIRTPTGTYNEQTAKSLSYSPDIQAKPTTESQIVVDVATGQNVPYRESAQARQQQELELRQKEERVAVLASPGGQPTPIPQQQEFLKNVDIALQQRKISPSTAESLRQNVYNPSARQIGFTDEGNVYNIPLSATFSYGYSSALVQPTGKETAADIIYQFRRQEVDLTTLPPNSVLNIGEKTYSLGGYYSPTEYADKLQKEGKLRVDYGILPSKVYSREGYEVESPQGLIWPGNYPLIQIDKSLLSAEEAQQKGISPYMTKESILGHELLHLQYPNLSEAEIKKKQIELTDSKQWFYKPSEIAETRISPSFGVLGGIARQSVYKRELVQYQREKGADKLYTEATKTPFEIKIAEIESLPFSERLIAKSTLIEGTQPKSLANYLKIAGYGATGSVIYAGRHPIKTFVEAPIELATDIGYSARQKKIPDIFYQYAQRPLSTTFQLVPFLVAGELIGAKTRVDMKSINKKILEAEKTFKGVGYETKIVTEGIPPTPKTTKSDVYSYSLKGEPILSEKGIIEPPTMEISGKPTQFTTITKIDSGKLKGEIYQLTTPSLKKPVGYGKYTYGKYDIEQMFGIEGTTTRVTKGGRLISEKFVPIEKEPPIIDFTLDIKKEAPQIKEPITYEFPSGEAQAKVESTQGFSIFGERETAKPKYFMFEEALKEKLQAQAKAESFQDIYATPKQAVLSKYKQSDIVVKKPQEFGLSFEDIDILERQLGAPIKKVSQETLGQISTTARAKLLEGTKLMDYLYGIKVRPKLIETGATFAMQQFPTIDLLTGRSVMRLPPKFTKKPETISPDITGVGFKKGTREKLQLASIESRTSRKIQTEIKIEGKITPKVETRLRGVEAPEGVEAGGFLTTGIMEDLETTFMQQQPTRVSTKPSTPQIKLQFRNLDVGFDQFSRVKPRVIPTRISTKRDKEAEKINLEMQQIFSQEEPTLIPLYKQQQPTKISITPKEQIKIPEIQKPFTPTKVGITQITRTEVSITPDMTTELKKIIVPPPITPEISTPEVFIPKVPPPSKIPVPFVFPKLPKGFEEPSGFARMLKSKRRKGYSSSLVAEEFGIVSKKTYKELAKQTYSGIGIRPLIKGFPKPKRTFKRKK